MVRVSNLGMVDMYHEHSVYGMFCPWNQRIMSIVRISVL